MTNEKILKDEIMNEAELDMVAGGNRDELALDTQLFNAMGNRSKAYDLEDITNTNVNGISAKITSLYGKFGIEVKYNDFGASNYYINGQWISRNQAVTEALNRAGYHDIDPKPFQIWLNTAIKKNPSAEVGGFFIMNFLLKNFIGSCNKISRLAYNGQKENSNQI